MKRFFYPVKRLEKDAAFMHSAGSHPLSPVSLLILISEMDPQQIQSLRRGGRSSLASIFLCQDLARPGDGLFITSNLDQGTDDVPDHVIEETIGFNLQADARCIPGFDPANVDIQHGAHGGDSRSRMSRSS